jgi:hypothetical protein
MTLEVSTALRLWDTWPVRRLLAELQGQGFGVETAGPPVPHVPDSAKPQSGSVKHLGKEPEVVLPPFLAFVLPAI